MLVFRYDKSFDGLLSALFDAYAMRAFPEQLIGPGEPEPLFTERVHEVATDPAHAARVWRGLERRLVVRARSMLVYAWHGEQERSDLLMLRCMRRVFDEGAAPAGAQSFARVRAAQAVRPASEGCRRHLFCRRHSRTRRPAAVAGLLYGPFRRPAVAYLRPAARLRILLRRADGAPGDARRRPRHDRRQARRPLAGRGRTAVSAALEELFPGAGDSPADQRASAAAHDAPPLLEASDRNGVNGRCWRWE